MSDAWRMEINFTEYDRTTRADVMLEVAGNHHHGWERAKPDPVETDVPSSGSRWRRRGR